MEERISGAIIHQGAKAEDRELAAAILAGEMKNAWQQEDRPNQQDHRPPAMKKVCVGAKAPSWYVHYDRIFGKER